MRFIYNRYREIKILLENYSFSPIKKENCIIFMVDGKIRHGGLADRLSGIMNIYAVCKVRNISFKLYWIFPFEIQNYLIPNEYNWIIQEDEISYSMKYSRVVVKIQEDTVLKNLKLNKQIHIYCNNKNLDQINNVYHANFKYSDLFNELFKRPESLQRKFNTIINNNLKNTYIGIQFRFMDLLGDFNEERLCNELPDFKKQELLTLCYNIVKYICNIYHEHIFLTSDSMTFLTYIAERMDNIFFIPGNTTHMDRESNASLLIHEKTFLDFFVLASARKIINIYGHGLYKSNFGIFASKIYNRDFQAIDIDRDIDSSLRI
jgi:hypothetical protein